MFPPKPSDTLPLEVDAQRRCVQNTTHSLTCHVSIFFQLWCKKLHQLIKRLLGHSIITQEGFATLQISHVLFPIYTLCIVDHGPDLRSLKGVSFPSGESSSEYNGGNYGLFERLAYLIYEGSAAESRRFLESDMA